MDFEFLTFGQPWPPQEVVAEAVAELSSKAVSCASTVFARLAVPSQYQVPWLLAGCSSSCLTPLSLSAGRAACMPRNLIGNLLMQDLPLESVQLKLGSSAVRKFA